MIFKFGANRHFPAAISVLAFAASAFGATAYINQIGYRASDSKEFALEGGTGDVEILDGNGQTVLTKTPTANVHWDASGQIVQLVDFSELETPGVYSIRVDGQIVRSDLNIFDGKVFEDVAKAALKWFYYQRASMDLEETYAGKWKRAAGHTNPTATLHGSTGASGSISTSKGWYDAGDYGRYIVNSGITTYTLLALYEHFPAYFETLRWNIPAEGSLPDLLAEIKYNLDWMLTMQAQDGGVYHKLTSLGFPGDVMPARDASELYVIGKGTAATLDFAGVMATAYRVFKAFDGAFAAKCLEAAQKAYDWGMQNPRIAFSNPADVSTGEYGDGDLDDEMQFAKTELFISTGEASYKPTISEGNVPNWGDVSGLALYDLATHGKLAGESAETAKNVIVQKGEEFANRAKEFGIVMASGDFVWGSNAVAANQGIWLLHAYYLTGENKFYDAARKVLDYLLGKNPLNMSFVTSFGAKSPLKPHHRPSTADGVAAPVPGMLVGGPQPGGEDIGSESWECRDYRTGYPATSYTDDRCSYASNEVAINWNAPFAYLAGAVEALNNGFKPNFAENVAAIRPVAKRATSARNKARLRFEEQKVFIEKNGKRFDLKGTQIR